MGAELEGGACVARRALLALEWGCYGLGAATVAFGALATFLFLLRELPRREGEPWQAVLAQARTGLSSWLTLGLTFFLVAEVLRTFRITTGGQLLRVSAVVLLRQFIVWSLDKDVARIRREFPQSLKDT